MTIANIHRTSVPAQFDTIADFIIMNRLLGVTLSATDIHPEPYQEFCM